MSAIKLQKTYLVKLHNKQHVQEKQQQQQQGVQQQQQHQQHQQQHQLHEQHVEPTFNQQNNLLLNSFFSSMTIIPSTSPITGLYYRLNYSSCCLERYHSNAFFNYLYIRLCHYYFCILYPAAATTSAAIAFLFSSCTIAVAHFKYFTTNYVKSYCHIKRHGVNNNKTLCWLTLTLILLSGIWNTPNNGLVACLAFDIENHK
ncbi:hypothetical protein FF38_12018 [Lucilia cuprina]|uniref:Uncharacterized protein n=1 Tax=Lucilia cuprina TaxID=7375 RepID=A0A0L0CFF5_LUCCU|nr:hypothetical protein FF38_12018 [Lucilia cuprina]